MKRLLSMSAANRKTVWPDDVMRSLQYNLKATLKLLRLNTLDRSG